MAQRPVGNHRIYQHGVPGADKRGKGTEKILKEIMDETFSNFMKNINQHIQEAQ